MTSSFSESWEQRLQQAIQGSPEAFAEIQKDPLLLKEWLIKQSSHHSGSLVSSTPPRHPARDLSETYLARFLDRGVPLQLDDLKQQIACFKKDASYLKSDVQWIEQCLLKGSLDELKACIQRSPMALWAMNFSLSSYEQENVLMFVAKHTPTPFDEPIIDYLLHQGVELLPQGSDQMINLTTMLSGPVAPTLNSTLPPPSFLTSVSPPPPSTPAPVFQPKAPEDILKALTRAGLVLNRQYALQMVTQTRYEQQDACFTLQKIHWLELMQSQYSVSLSERITDPDSLPFQLLPAEIVANTPPKSMIYTPQHLILSSTFEAQASSFFHQHGYFSLGVAFGLQALPLRHYDHWGPWFIRQDLIYDAYQAAQCTRASTTIQSLLPYYEKALLNASLSDCSKPQPTAVLRL